MNFRPLRDMLVIRRTQTPSTSTGGIHLTKTAQELPTEGLVLVVGPGKRMKNGELRNTAIKAGDVVVFGSSVGSEINIDGELVVLMREEDVMGIVGNSVNIPPP